MPDPPEMVDILAAPTDASEITGTEQVLTAPATNADKFLIYGPPWLPPKTIACLSYNVGANEFLNDDEWLRRCEATLGFTRGAVIQKFFPTILDYRSFFSSKPHWIFFAGHLTYTGLGGSVVTDKNPPYGCILFEEQGVTARSDVDEVALVKGHDFLVHENCEVTFWAGCSAVKYETTATRIGNLFGTKQLLLGFRAGSNWLVSFFMLGGILTSDDDSQTGIMSGHFFDRVKKDPSDLILVRDAWLDSALACIADPSINANFIQWQKDDQGKAKPHFDAAAAIDPSGQIWGLNNGIKSKFRWVRGTAEPQ